MDMSKTKAYVLIILLSSILLAFTFLLGAYINMPTEGKSNTFSWYMVLYPAMTLNAYFQVAAFFKKHFVFKGERVDLATIIEKIEKLR